MHAVNACVKRSSQRSSRFIRLHVLARLFISTKLFVPDWKLSKQLVTKKAINVTKQTPFVLSVCVTILRYLSRVFTSCFHMRLPHFVAISYYLPWSCSIKVSNKNCIAMWKMHAETGCVNSPLRMLHYRKCFSPLHWAVFFSGL